MTSYFADLPLSIITINFNNKTGVTKTLQSVIEQDYKNFEYIIIDGGSTDGSKELIESHASNLAYWVSEKDNGIYHAMNKGIAKAKGKYLLFLNSGDYLINANVISNVFSTNPTADILYGDLQTENRLLTYPSKLDFAFFFKGSIGHGASFIMKSLFEKIGIYNEENKLVSDWEFFVKAVIVNNASYQHLAQVISFFNSDGASNVAENYKVHMEERGRVLEPLFHQYYPQLLAHINCLENELYLYKNSRAVSLLKKILNRPVFGLLKK